MTEFLLFIIAWPLGLKLERFLTMKWKQWRRISCYEASIREVRRERI